ncbi:MAG: pantetheine-phosphate adenylyltransferase [Verrucomicrobia bacterium]|nr:pantetheine-phosphate adenylyltransferase [Verrucomicrobiota bacterium]
MKRGIYPGSFDPITNGHLDVILRAEQLFDEVVIAVAHNYQKSSLFTKEERVALIEETVAGHDRINVTSFDGLLVDFARDQGASALVRGIRALSDFEFEFQMALMNRKLAPGIETIFLMPKEEYSYISSRMVKEIARLHGDIKGFVPKNVQKALLSKLR